MAFNWTGIGEGFVGGTINQIGSGIVSSLFGPSVKRQLRWQKEAQMELNRQAAELNYRYGERSAENAFNRQMQMYERSYNDQSYKAMRGQMEDAGLNVGLMYGGAGSGGGQGSMTGAPQGATGGAVAGDAASGLSAAIAMKQLQLQQASVYAQNAKAYAEADEIKTRAKKEETETGQIETATQQARDSFEWVLENLKEDAKGKWLDNSAKQFNMEIDDWDGKKKITSEKFGELTIKARGIFNSQTISTAIEAAAKKNDVEGANMLRAVEAAYQDEKTKWIATEVYTAVRLADVAERNATVAEQNATTERLKVKIQELATKSGVKLNDAIAKRAAEATKLQAQGLGLEASKIWAEIDALEKTTEFNTGAWAKTKIVLQGIGSIGGIAADVATKGSYSKAKALEKSMMDDFDQPW